MGYSDLINRGRVSMSKVICIGEALIDFMPSETGYVPCAGGAPANVAACVKKLGGEAQFITKLGKDFFGDFLMKTITDAGINVSSVYQTEEANTGLAFVSHGENGERSFLFYRNPSSDMLLDASEIKSEWFETGDVLHFCSVDLVDAPVRYAHDRAIELALANKCLICFDPNVRLPLWKDHEEYKRIINKYIDCADILKISDEELFFITGIDDEAKAINHLLSRVEVVVYTKGSKGACVYTKAYSVEHKGFKTVAVDTTGAGDSFIGSFLYQIASSQINGQLAVNKVQMEEILKVSNAVASLVVSKKGTINVMPTMDEVKEVIE